MASRRRQTQTPKAQQTPEWDFFSFPVFVSFFGGMFIAAILISFELGGYAGPVHFAVLLVSLFASSWALSRFIARTVSARRAQSRLTRADEEESERRVLAARARAAAGAAEGGEGATPRRRRRRRS